MKTFNFPTGETVEIFETEEEKNNLLDKALKKNANFNTDKELALKSTEKIIKISLKKNKHVLIFQQPNNSFVKPPRIWNYSFFSVNMKKTYYNLYRLTKKEQETLNRKMDFFYGIMGKEPMLDNILKNITTGQYLYSLSSNNTIIKHQIQWILIAFNYSAYYVKVKLHDIRQECLATSIDENGVISFAFKTGKMHTDINQLKTQILEGLTKQREEYLSRLRKIATKIREINDFQ